MNHLSQLLRKHKPQAWICSCGCMIPKKAAKLSDGLQYAEGYHVHCPQCSRTVAQYVNPKITR